MNLCKCNCGTEVTKDWATGHHRRGTTFNHTQEAKDKCRSAKIGSLNPRYGKTGTRTGFTHTEESKAKIKEARAKQVFSDESLIKRSDTLKQQWKDGTRTVDKCAFYIDGRHSGKTPIKQSIEYKLWRKAVFERDNYTCKHCNERGGELQADHIKPQSVFPELRLDLNNGQTLCRPCHLKTDTWGIRVTNDKTKTTNILLAIKTMV